MPDRLLHGRQRLARERTDADLELARQLTAALVRADRGGQLLLLDDHLVERCLLAAGKQPSQHTERVRVGGELLRRRKHHVQFRRSRKVVLVECPFGLRQCDGPGLRIRDRPAGLDLSEVLLDPGPGLLPIEVTGDHQRRVVRSVPLPEEVANVLDRRIGEVLERADDLPAVGVIGRIQQLVEHVPRVAVGNVVDPLPLLVLHHGLLIHEGFLRHRREQVSQAIRLEPQRHLERILRYDLEVDRLVRRRAAVQRAAGGLHFLEEFVLADVLGGLEHHVLEQVGEPRLSDLLACGPDVVQHRHRGDRVGTVLVQHHLQPVVELVRFIVDLEIGAALTGAEQYADGRER